MSVWDIGAGLACKDDKGSAFVISGMRRRKKSGGGRTVSKKRLPQEEGLPAGFRTLEISKKVGFYLHSLHVCSFEYNSS